jgi:hypothetical protein
MGPLLRVALNTAAHARERLRQLRDGAFDGLPQRSGDLTDGCRDLFDRSGDTFEDFLRRGFSDRRCPSRRGLGHRLRTRGPRRGCGRGA